MDARHAVVTGAASGIGAAVVRRLLADGWRVTGLDRAPQAAAERLTPITVDLTERDRLAAVAADLAAARPTALVHSAGIMRADDDAGTRASGGATLWALHVAAAALLIETLTPAMPDRDGRVVVLSSRAAQGRPGRMFYAASKGGVEAMVRCAAGALVSRGITVNAVAPGATDTPQLVDPARAGAPIKRPPIGRLIAPAEVAALIGFLLGPEAGAITGQTLTICGGASLTVS
ncbi:SDR family NAD(P)-dependent oxidoreductase [Rhodoplanes sp. TEM]|uniref:SDR family NAD(P)-dependent oxidoreductase n=1 Tax=Rhodoplanes tepidamans TaxID=200616 RepID=A0ABT5J7I2_RHOTP|nr:MULTISPECIES: SDR family oxidoreductase [Rhodoplanes]MDC7785610.1 SDR family NAD(P)-dependent oxidoreductase [Rhodoplanes tepidamans]MDC7985711.1 SDR family NAD(P)-dependent oxidoreductase [Rhodoplanes sp. TEM]MDQ0354824.1 NAD(P)-dependent dehydrogenase (short-subunit alcohol dehydrogenase family) [Rhodoplanes tepidamans]